MSRTKPWMCWLLVWLILVAVALLGFRAYGADGLIAGYYTTRWADRVRVRNLSEKSGE